MNALKRFDELVWNKLIEAIEQQDRVIRTLERKKRNIIIDIKPEGFLVTTKSEPQFVPKQWIYEAWNVLETNGRLARNDLPGQGRFRSAFILAALALLPFVNVQKTTPIALTLNNLHDKEPIGYRDNDDSFENFDDEEERSFPERAK